MGHVDTPAGAHPAMFFSRFTIPGVGRTPVEGANGGIALVAARLASEAVLALVADLNGIGLPNLGAAVTTSIEDIVVAYWPRLCQHFSVSEDDVIWIEWHSSGRLDMLVPRRDPRNSSVIHPHWRPLNSGVGLTCRTANDLVAAFGPPAAEIVAAVLALKEANCAF